MKRNLVLSAACALALSSAAATAQQASTAPASGELEEIIVYGSQITLPPAYAGGQVATGGRAGILGNMDTLDTPFSSTNYTSELMVNQQAKSIADVLLNDPNVRVTRGFGNFQELYVIRGFPAYSDDMTYNGIYGILPRQFVAAEFLERAEVFRGANAFLNGAAPGGSNLGGTINLVPKRAPNEGLTRLTAGLESDGNGLIAADFGRRFGEGQSMGMRANGVYRDGETSVQDQDRQLAVLSLGVDYRGDDLRLSADMGYQYQDIDEPRPSVFPAFGATAVPKAPDADKNFAQPWTYTKEKQVFGVVRAEYDITSSLSAWGAAGARDGEEGNVLSNPNAQADGTTQSYRFDNKRKDTVYSAELGLRWDVATGPVEHRFIVSGSLFSIDSKNAYAFSEFFPGFNSDLYHPVDALPAPTANYFTGGSLQDPHKTFATDTSSWALADMMKFADGKFILTLGARDQKLKTETFNYNSGDKESSYDKSKTTPVGGIVFRPSEKWSIFANYIQGLIAGDIAPTTGPGGGVVVNGGQVQDPYTADQIEAGVKFDGGSFGAGLSVFNIEKALGILEPLTPGDSETEYRYNSDGKQRHRGVEANVYGEPMSGLRLIGGATWLDAEMTKTQGGINEGKDVIGAPKTQANLNVEWDMPGVKGLTFDARAMYTSKQYADGANTLEVDSWTRFDIGARYITEMWAKQVALRARINNVTNENSWISAGGYPGFGYYVLGDPMTFVVSASIDF
jgi:iron complex outermembrane receptor protein